MKMGDYSANKRRFGRVVGIGVGIIVKGKDPMGVVEFRHSYGGWPSSDSEVMTPARSARVRTDRT